MSWLMSIIKVTDLSFSYKSNAIKVLDKISLEIATGSIFGLIGKNGAGKTTFFQVLLGILIPDCGTIVISGDEQRKLVDNRMGFVPELPNYHQKFKLEEYLFYLNKISRVPVTDQEIDDLIRLVHLDGFQDEYIKNFSKGMSQRLGVAQALLNQPEILILDEPMSGLDLVGQDLMRDVILQLNRQGKTVILSSHNLYEIERLSSEIGILHEGQLKLIEIDKINLTKRYCLMLNEQEKRVYQEFDSFFADDKQVSRNQEKISFPSDDNELYFKIMGYLNRKKIRLRKLDTPTPSLERIIIDYLTEEGESHA